MKQILGVMETFAVVLLAGSTMIAFVNVVARYAFSSPIAWSDEMNVLAMVWMVYIPQGILERNNDQLRLTVLYNIMGVKLRTAINILRTILTLGVGVSLCYAGMEIVVKNWQIKVFTQALGFPIWIAYLSLPLAFGMITVARILNPLIKNPPIPVSEEGGRP
jgi:TRAP-type C4-dicarboxylate transport system permease small subunit